jgi:hypothetical protein
MNLARGGSTGVTNLHPAPPEATELTTSEGSVTNILLQSFSCRSLRSVTEGTMFKGGHFDRSGILFCMRWYLAHNLSIWNLEEMMAERGISVGHVTMHRWVVQSSPELLELFNRRKRVVTSRWTRRIPSCAASGRHRQLKT